MALAKCEKFTANIYDKNRCKNCYRPKEVHSEAALESNKVICAISVVGMLWRISKKYTDVSFSCNFFWGFHSCY